MMRTVDTLYRLLAPSSTTARLRTAKIEAATATTATINFVGSSVTEVQFLATYTPTVGDTVLVLQTEGGLLVILGKTA